MAQKAFSMREGDKPNHRADEETTQGMNMIDHADNDDEKKKNFLHDHPRRNQRRPGPVGAAARNKRPWSSWPRRLPISALYAPATGPRLHDVHRRRTPIQIRTALPTIIATSTAGGAAADAVCCRLPIRARTSERRSRGGCAR